MLNSQWKYSHLHVFSCCCCCQTTGMWPIKSPKLPLKSWFYYHSVTKHKLKTKTVLWFTKTIIQIGVSERLNNRGEEVLSTPEIKKNTQIRLLRYIDDKEMIKQSHPIVTFCTKDTWNYRDNHILYGCCKSSRFQSSSGLLPALISGHTIFDFDARL